jgi:hypothetical protein
MAAVRVYQQPGKPWSFGRDDTGVLPEVGKHNAFARWMRDPSCKTLGGYWLSRKQCNATRNKARRGQGRFGILTVARRMLNSARTLAKARGFKPPRITAARLAEMLSSELFVCWMTDRILAKPHLDHDHSTGEVRGFADGSANRIEGLMLNFSDLEISKLVLRTRPHVAALLAQFGGKNGNASSRC